MSDERKVPDGVAKGSQMLYRSSGLGVWGAVLRFGGMPLEKIALFSNSSQVSGSGQLQQAVKLTFKDGMLAPFKVVGPASFVAWFLQYSVMGFVFQSCDSALSSAMGVPTVVYGDELFEPVVKSETPVPVTDSLKSVAKAVAAPMAAGAIESIVSNRAEVQRFYGIDKFAKIEAKLGWSAVSRNLGPAFVANSSRNFVMSTTSFVLTPILYKNFFPQEKKSHSSLFWFGLGFNIFCGNVVGITQQALWGRALDYGQVDGGRNISYRGVISEGLQKEGWSAFFTPSKWFARVLMNAPAQGTIPWFYNQVLPIGEPAVMSVTRSVYFTFNK